MRKPNGTVTRVSISFLTLMSFSERSDREGMEDPTELREEDERVRRM